MFQIKPEIVTMKFLICVTLTFLLIINSQVSIFLNFIFVSSFLKGLNEEQTEKLNKLSKECRALSGVSQDTISNARNGNFEDDPKLKEQILCIAKKVEIMTESGEVNNEVLRRKLRKVADSDEEAEKVFNKCATKKSTPGETAYETIKCIIKNKPKFSPVD